MALHLAARLHAFLHGLLRPKEASETAALYERVQADFVAGGLESIAGRAALLAAIVEDIATHFSIAIDHPQQAIIHTLTRRLFELEALYVLPDFLKEQRYTIAAYWDIRQELTRQQQLVNDLNTSGALVRDTLIDLLTPLYAACPALLAPAALDEDISLPSLLLPSLPNIGVVVEAMLQVGLDDTAFPRLAHTLTRNLVAVSGGHPDKLAEFNRAPKLPTQASGKAEAIVSGYLGDTPLAPLFAQSISCTIPHQTRFEHQHIIGGSGHGKTQSLQYLIERDLAAVAKGERSIIVIDSQGDLIGNLSRLKLFAPGQPLYDRLVLIDPHDVEYPVSLNLFDVGQQRLSGYAPLERERLTNSILELYDFVLGSLLSAEMTQKQTVIFRYVTRLMLHIPNATIHTLRELLEPNGTERFKAAIETLTGTARQFFQTEFMSKEFEQTKRQVVRRLWGILENQAFERMFAHPRSKLDLYSEMNAGKVILINTAKDLLKEQGTELFGRFFIALIAQAAQERATLPLTKRLPTFVYIDEAADYFDRTLSIILSQARKYNVGMILAHQYLGQLNPQLQEAVAANTSIKCAGGVSAKDAKTLAAMMGGDSDLIETQGKGSFATYVRGVTPRAVPLQFPFGVIEQLPKQTKKEAELVRERIRRLYAAPLVADTPELQPIKETDTPATPARGQIDTDASETW
jgi:hypothetical protein